MKDAARIGRKIGAMAGAIVFLAFGLVPGFYFGSYGTLVVLNHLLGHSVEPSVIVRMMVVVGTMLGLFCTASVSIVLGAVGGTVLGYAADALTAKPKEAAEKATTR
jgi:hypothetical protein